MQRRLTSETLRFIQLNPSEMSEDAACESAETIVGASEPFYAAAETIVAPRRALYIVPDPPKVERVEIDVFDSWLQREDTPEPVVLVPIRFWAQVAAAIRRLVATGRLG